LIVIAFWYELKNKILLYGLPFIWVISIINSIYLQPAQKNFNSNFINLEALLILLLSLYFFEKLIKNIPELGFFKEYPAFWISIGLLFFSVISVVIFGMYNFLLIKKTPLVQNVMLTLRSGANYLLYICFIIAFLSKQKELYVNTSK
jgi:hypothetical protein